MSIWARPVTAEQLNRDLDPDTLNWHLGLRFDEVGDDFLRASLPVDKRTRQPAGLFHGGASAALAETLGSIGSMLVVAGEDKQCLGLELNANHLRGASNGRVTGTARPLRLGRRTHVWDIRLEDDLGRMTCISRLTVMVVPND